MEKKIFGFVDNCVKERLKIFPVSQGFICMAGRQKFL